MPRPSRASLREHSREIETQAAQSQKAVDAATKQKQAAESTIAELRQSLEQEQKKTATLMQEAKAAQAMATAAEPQRRALEEAQARAAALASELAGNTPRDRDPGRAVAKGSRCGHETEAGGGEHYRGTATSSGAGATEDRHGDAGSQGRASDGDGAEPQRRALEEAQARAAALASELAGKSREIESQAAQSQKAVDAATKQKQAAESTIGELRQALEQEQQKTAKVTQEAKAAQAMAAAAQPTMDGRVTAARLSDNQDVNVTQTIKTAATEPPKAVEAQLSPEVARLIARASALLGQGNIGAARIVLERAAESGSAQASFMLAETYDPVVLSAWGTYGTRAEASKAREYYAKAHTGGIQEAKGRLDALRQ